MSMLMAMYRREAIDGVNVGGTDDPFEFQIGCGVLRETLDVLVDFLKR